MKYVTVFLLTIIGLSINAQGRREEVREKIESRKIAFLSERLNLTPEVSQKFWPLYNVYNDEINKLHESLRPLYNSEKSEINVDEKLKLMIQQEESALAIKKKYVNQMKDAIGSEKTLKFFKFDREFKESMLKRLGERREEMRMKDH